MPTFDEQADEVLLQRAKLIHAEIVDAEATAERVLSYDSTTRTEHERSSWSIVVDATRLPIAVLPPSSLAKLAVSNPDEPLMVAAPGPDFLIADIRTTFRSVFHQAESFDLVDRTVVVIIDVDESEYRGLSTVGRLRSDFANVPPIHSRPVIHDPVLSMTRITLPGRPSIPLLVRRCSYRQSAVDCSHTERFVVKPPVMPPCKNPRHLHQHSFVW